MYFSEDLKNEITSIVVNYGSSDHLPVSSKINAQVNRKNYKKTILKRRMKNFTNILWNEALEKQDWSQIHSEPSVDKKAEIFTELVTNSLDEVAPYCSITIRSNYRFGLSEETKELMKKREAARSKIKLTVGNEKQVWNSKYKSQA